VVRVSLRRYGLILEIKYYWYVAEDIPAEINVLVVGIPAEIHVTMVGIPAEIHRIHWIVEGLTHELKLAKIFAALKS
jgi:hypothetical protein